MAIQPDPKFATLMGLRIGGDLDGVTYYINKRGKPTWFAKAPPTKPPTPKQRSQRNKFRLVAMLWSELPQLERDKWELICRRASLCLTGYNLFVHIQLSLDFASLHTLESQTGISVS